MLKLKDNTINPLGLTVEALLALIVAKDVYKENGFDCVVTSLMDGRHSRGSKHFSGNAFDLRTIAMSARHDWHKVGDAIRSCLNDRYDVVVEKDHIHIEFDPKEI